MKTPAQRSPQNICQELVRDDPWKVLVVYMFLNQTTGVQVRKVFPMFFERWPTPQAFLLADTDEAKEVIRSLGFKNRRYDRLFRMTVGYLMPGWTDARSLHGVGQYAADSWTIFVEGRIPEQVQDKELVKFCSWCRALPVGDLPSMEARGHARSEQGSTGSSHDGTGRVRCSGGESAAVPA